MIDPQLNLQLGVDQLREFDPSTEIVGIQIKVNRCFGGKIAVNVPLRAVTTPRMIQIARATYEYYKS